MAVITQQFLAAVFTNFVAAFQTAFLQAQTGLPDFVDEVTSETEAESYNWLGSGPRMREWTDERKTVGAGQHNFTIRNKDWEASFEVDRNTFEDDKLNLIKPLVNGLAHEAARHPRELAFSQVISGFTGLAWDGNAFFSDHTGGKNVWLNNNLGALALTSVNWGTAIKTLRAALDDRGRPMDPDLGAKTLKLVVGPANEEVARQLLNSDYTIGPAAASGGGGAGTLATNVWKGSATLEVTSYITDLKWYAIYGGTPGARPFIFQWRKKPQMTQLVNPNTTDSVFNRKKFKYGADSRYNAGFGNFAAAVASSKAS